MNWYRLKIKTCINSVDWLTLDISRFLDFNEDNIHQSKMISRKVAVYLLLLCVSYVLAEAPLSQRYRSQRYRQASRPFAFERQEAAPYPASSGGQPSAAYGPPSSPKPIYGAPPQPTTTPSPQYGAPPAPVDEPELVNPSTSDTEAIPGQPSRLRQFGGLNPPTKKNPSKFSQRLELQQQVQQFPAALQPPLLAAAPFPAPIPVAAPIQPVFASPYQLAALQHPEGSYFIQLPNGAIERVNYLTQPSLVDDSVLAKLEFRPVAEVQTTFAEPQLFVNTLVHSHVSTDEWSNIYDQLKKKQTAKFIVCRTQTICFARKIYISGFSLICVKIAFECFICKMRYKL